jgi:hypothetical protein
MKTSGFYAANMHGAAHASCPWQGDKVAANRGHFDVLLRKRA